MGKAAQKKESKNGQTRSQSSIMLEDWEAFISSIRKIEEHKETIKKCKEKVVSSDGGGNALQKMNEEALQVPANWSEEWWIQQDSTDQSVDASEKHFVVQKFLSDRWSSILWFLPKASQDSTRLARKLNQEYSLDIRCTRWGIWKGDMLVADIEEQEVLDTSEFHARRLPCNGHHHEEQWWNFHVPIADEAAKLYGGDQVFWKSTFKRDEPERGEKSENMVFEENRTGLNHCTQWRMTV